MPVWWGVKVRVKDILRIIIFLILIFDFDRQLYDALTLLSSSSNATNLRLTAYDSLFSSSVICLFFRSKFASFSCRSSRLRWLSAAARSFSSRNFISDLVSLSASSRACSLSVSSSSVTLTSSCWRASASAIRLGFCSSWTRLALKKGKKTLMWICLLSKPLNYKTHYNFTLLFV